MKRQIDKLLEENRNLKLELDSSKKGDKNDRNERQSKYKKDVEKQKKEN